MSDRHKADPARIVVDADVLAADLLVGGSAREVMDIVRSHSWLELVATDQLLADAVAVIRTLAGPELANDWLDVISERVLLVEQPTGDHPALAAAYRGDATHIISFDERLRSPAAGVNLRGRLDVSIRSPDAFLAVVDPGTIYELTFEETYPGPDRDPR